MPLQILVPLIVVGLVAVLAAVHFSGGSTPPPPMDDEAAAQRYLEDYPNDRVTEIIFDAHRQVAVLVLDRDGEIGLVQRIGKHSLTRRLTRTNLVSMKQVDGRLELVLRDFTLPKLKLEVGTETLKRIRTMIGAATGAMV